MGHLITVATCSLNQWALDFKGNVARILESIRVAKERGATLRIGPELEITRLNSVSSLSIDMAKIVGDTYLHSWEALGQILSSKEAKEILLDIG
ncbi:glutamine-dependent NAD(+) synthetase, partial [Lobosporangium transversale]